MPLIGKCCCCSLKTGTKIIGYLQIIVGTISTLYGFILLAALLSLEEYEIKEELKDRNQTASMEMEEIKSTNAIFAFLLLGVGTIVIFYLLYTALGIYLLIGVYKEIPKHIKIWLTIKLVFFTLAMAALFLKFFLLLFDFDSALNDRILFLVFDGLTILVVYNYYEECKENTVPITFEY